MKEELGLYIKTISPKCEDVIINYVQYYGNEESLLTQEEVRIIHELVTNSFPDNQVITLPSLCVLTALSLQELKMIQDIIYNTILDLEDN